MNVGADDGGGARTEYLRAVAALRRPKADGYSFATFKHAKSRFVSWIVDDEMMQIGSSWRGQIGRYFSKAQWGTWFASYQPFIEHYAILAEQARVEQFSVGMELIEVSKQESHMRSVCSAARARYTGSLTYGANHGNENSITWWDAVDVISQPIQSHCSQPIFSSTVRPQFR